MAPGPVPQNRQRPLHGPRDRSRGRVRAPRDSPQSQSHTTESRTAMPCATRRCVSSLDSTTGHELNPYYYRNDYVGVEQWSRNNRPQPLRAPRAAARAAPTLRQGVGQQPAFAGLRRGLRPAKARTRLTLPDTSGCRVPRPLPPSQPRHDTQGEPPCRTAANFSTSPSTPSANRPPTPAAPLTSASWANSPSPSAPTASSSPLPSGPRARASRSSQERDASAPLSLPNSFPFPPALSISAIPRQSFGS